MKIKYWQNTCNGVEVVLDIKVQNEVCELLTIGNTDNRPGAPSGMSQAEVNYE